MTDTSDTGPVRCGFVAVIGAPNAGKSTLINRLVGAKVCIVTHKVQTTRTRIRAIAIHGRSQIVFVQRQTGRHSVNDDDVPRPMALAGRRNAKCLPERIARHWLPQLKERKDALSACYRLFSNQASNVGAEAGV